MALDPRLAEAIIEISRKARVLEKMEDLARNYENERKKFKTLADSSKLDSEAAATDLKATMEQYKDVLFPPPAPTPETPPA